MTRPLLLATVPVLLATALAAAPETAFAGGPSERAVAQCRAELVARFAEGDLRQYRIAEISGNSRRTRVTFVVNADRRYRFECAADAQGAILVAELDPPRSAAPRLAAGRR